MKINAYTQAKLTTFVLALTFTFTTGCLSSDEDDADGKYLFTNESSYTVTLRTAPFSHSTGDMVTTRSIPPGNKVIVSGILMGDTYRLAYDYEPENKVKDNQIKNDRVVFTDRVAL